jgi:hypothetical protein
MDRTKENSEVKAIIEAALAVASKRRDILMRLREALLNNNFPEALNLAKELCGLDEQRCNRTDSRIN